MAAASSMDGTAQAIVPMTNAPTVGQPRGRQEAELSPGPAGAHGGAKQARHHLSSPIAGATMDQKVTSLRDNVLAAFQIIENIYEEKFKDVYARITTNENAQGDTQRGLETLIGDMPNRFGSADAVQSNRVRLEVCVNNHNEAIGKLAEFEKMIAEWSVKSDANAGRIDGVVHSVGEMTQNLGNVTGATFAELRDNMNAIEVKVNNLILKDGANAIASNATGADAALIQERLATMKREIQEYTDNGLNASRSRLKSTPTM